MSSKHYIGFLVALTMLIVCRTNAQNSSKFWINVYDNLGVNYSNQFGNNVSATYGIDYPLNEAEATPCPPGLCVMWVNIPGHVNSWFPGLILNDWRAFPTNPEQKDTFQLRFVNADYADTNIYFTWPDAAYLGARCDSMFFVFFDASIPPNITTINMFKQSYLDIPAAGTSGISRAFIYKYGTKTIDDITPDKNIRPARFRLNQNYPNPFNPTTTVSFGISHLSFVSLKAYDVFGREVATLLNKEMAPGNYTQEWNAFNIVSGIYFLRLQAEDFIDVKKMVLLK